MKSTQRATDEKVLHDKIEILIAIGAAMAANCIPCFEQLYEKAIGSGISGAEIQWASEIAGRVKNGANFALKNYVNEFIGTKESQSPACDKTEITSCRC